MKKLNISIHEDLRTVRQDLVLATSGGSTRASIRFNFSYCSWVRLKKRLLQ